MKSEKLHATEASPYNKDWFEKRAFASIKKIAPGIWDYSDSLLLYVDTKDDVYEAAQETDTPYFRMVTKPEREYLELIAEKIVRELPNHFNYIDLGPGTEHKEQIFFDEIKKQGKTFTYIPVDISEKYLNFAEQFAHTQGVVVEPVRAAFEDVAAKMSDTDTPRLVSLGLTFSNYDASNVIELLRGIAGEGGFIFINTQMRDRIDMGELTKIYLSVSSIAGPKLKLLGMNLEDVADIITDDGIRLWATVARTNAVAQALGIVEGDRMLLLQSIRYTKEELEEVLNKTHASYRLFDEGDSFIAAMIKT